MSRAKMPISVLFVGGPIDGQWQHILGEWNGTRFEPCRTVDIDETGSACGLVPADSPLDMVFDRKVVRYTVYEVVFPGDPLPKARWVAVPSHIHSPYDYILSLYSTNAITARNQ